MKKSEFYEKHWTPSHKLRDFEREMLDSPSKKPSTHEVLDLHYLPEEGQGAFIGTYQECLDFLSSQTPHFMYKIVPLTKEQYDHINSK